MSFYVTKASGEQELFHEQKFRRSLARSGAHPDVIEQLVADIYQQKPATTKEIYRYALHQLQKQNIPVAARYNLKQALINFGPAGYPFEQFVEQLYQKQGYRTKQSVIMKGVCVSHEVDVLAEKDLCTYIIECKFRNDQKIQSDVKVPLYIKARFEDIVTVLRSQHHKMVYRATIITNTRFTSMAIDYAQCADIQMISWGYPIHNALPDLINRYQLHPITAIPHLSKVQQQNLVRKGLVLCGQAPYFKNELQQLGFSDHQAAQFIAHAQEICSITPTRIDHADD